MSKCKTCIELAEWQNCLDSSKDYKSYQFIIKLKSPKNDLIKTKQSFIRLKYCPNCATRLTKKYLRDLYKEKN